MIAAGSDAVDASPPPRAYPVRKLDVRRRPRPRHRPTARSDTGPPTDATRSWSRSPHGSEHRSTIRTAHASSQQSCPPADRVEDVPQPRQRQPAPIRPPGVPIPQRRRTHRGRNRPVSQISWRTTVADPPTEDTPLPAERRVVSLLRRVAGLRSAGAACPRFPAGRGAVRSETHAEYFRACHELVAD